MYFYPALITELLGPEEVKVTFLADRIERRLRTDSGVITVDQLRPGDQLSVKHDVYSAYEVTAALLKVTRRGRNDYDYQVKICATDSEPQNNEDTRVVKHEEITLNGELELELRSEMIILPCNYREPSSCSIACLWAGAGQQHDVSRHRFV